MSRRCTRFVVNLPMPICEIDSSCLWDVALAMASGSSRGNGRTSLAGSTRHTSTLTADINTLDCHSSQWSKVLVRRTVKVKVLKEQIILHILYCIKWRPRRQRGREGDMEDGDQKSSTC